MTESVFLKVTSAFLVGGEIARAGEIVEVSLTEAKDLLNRGKAVLANESDAPKVAPRPLAVGDTKDDDEAETSPVVETETKTRGRKKGK
jgi:hypothetical protein